MILLAAALFAQSAPATNQSVPASPTAVTFSVQGGRAGSPLRSVAIASVGGSDARFTLTTTHFHGRVETSETTLGSCPAARAPLEALASLGPGLAVPGILRAPESIVIPMDRTTYRLEASLLHPDSPSGTLAMTSYSGSALADWAGAMLSALRECWRAVEPARAAPRNP